MLLLRLSYMDRTVDLEELLRAMGGAPAPRGGAGSLPSEPSRGEPRKDPAAQRDEPEPPSADGAAARTASEAWTAWLDSGRGVPRGLSAFLRTAAVREVGDAVEVVPPPGPAVERLAQPAVLEAVRSGLSAHLGRPVQVRVRPVGGSAAQPSRVSPEEVRADTLKSLYRKEPRLERAVQELDLELME